MMDPFEAARLKVERAQEHLTAVEQEIDTYLAHKSPSFDNPTDAGQPVVGDLRSAPLLHLTSVVGDCLSNLRTSLDLAFWALALETGPKDPDRDRIAFPIFSNEAKFRAAEGGIARHISAEALRALEMVQPFRTRHAALTTLWALSNRDRHGFLALGVRKAASEGPQSRFVAFEHRAVPAIGVERLLATILRHVSTDVLPTFEHLGS